jgi:hypothetical protein
LSALFNFSRNGSKVACQRSQITSISALLATTAYVAEQWGRRWITIDTSRVALTLARARLMGAKYDYYLLKDSKEGAAKEGEITGKPPTEGPFSSNIRHGFVYERAPHVTLKSIPEPQVGSRTRSPGSVVMSKHRSITAGLV